MQSTWPLQSATISEPSPHRPSTNPISLQKPPVPRREWGGANRTGLAPKTTDSRESHHLPPSAFSPNSLSPTGRARACGGTTGHLLSRRSCRRWPPGSHLEPAAGAHSQTTTESCRRESRSPAPRLVVITVHPKGLSSSPLSPCPPAPRPPMMCHGSVQHHDRPLTGATSVTLPASIHHPQVRSGGSILPLAPRPGSDSVHSADGDSGGVPRSWLCLRAGLVCSRPGWSALSVSLSLFSPLLLAAPSPSRAAARPGSRCWPGSYIGGLSAAAQLPFLSFSSPASNRPSTIIPGFSFFPPFVC